MTTTKTERDLMFGKSQPLDAIKEANQEYDRTWEAAQRTLTMIATEVIEELVELQSYLDALLAQSREAGNEENYRIDTPELAVKFIALLLKGDSAAASVAEELVRQRDFDSQEEVAVRDEAEQFLGRSRGGE